MRSRFHLPFGPTSSTTSSSNSSLSTPEPDLDRQRQQPLLGGPNQLAQRLLHPLREHDPVFDRLGDRYVEFTAVPP